MLIMQKLRLNAVLPPVYLTLGETVYATTTQQPTAWKIPLHHHCSAVTYLILLGLRPMWEFSQLEQTFSTE